MPTIYNLIASCVLIAVMIPCTGQIKINELSALKGVNDEEGAESDWFEIINYSSETVDISGYYFSDDANNPQKWLLPSDILQPMEILPILASGKDRPYRVKHWETIIHAEEDWSYFPGTSEPPTSWKNQGFDDSSWENGSGGIGFGDGDDGTTISSVGSVYLRKTFDISTLDNLAFLVLHADYDDGFVAYINGIEFARSSNLVGYPPAYSTFANAGHEASLYQGGIPELYGVAAPNIESYIQPGENTIAIQVHNDTFFSSDLSSNFFLSVGITNDDFDYQSTPAWFNLPETAYHTNFKLSVGEDLLVVNNLGILQDQVLINPDLSLGLSEGRSPDGSDNWCIFDTPTPAMSNSDSWCYNGIEPAPSVSLESGWYSGTQTIGVSPSSGTQTIRYTLNGDLPDQGNLSYSNPIQVNANTVFSARAFSTANLLPSPVVDRTYIFGEDNHDLAVFSLITDSLNLWGWEEGIYVYGPNADLDNYPYYGSNFWEPWSKFSRLEYFDQDKTKRAEGQFDLEIHGGWSRAEPQKSFRVDMKSIYSGPLNWPIIDDKPFITSFSNFNLRNGGQHTWSDKIQDAFIGRLVAQTHADNMGYEPCIVYLNGKYWGVYGIREKIDEHYVEDNYNIPSDEVDLLNSWNTLAGSASNFYEAHDLLMTADPESDDYYDLAANYFDLENYKDYFIVETYVQNLDWIGIAWGVNNMKLWRHHTDEGRWRYVVYDTDGGLGYFSWNPWQNYIEVARSPAVANDHSDIFNRVLQNPQFKHEFVNRYADLMNTIFTQNSFFTTISNMQADLQDAMVDHVDFWETPPSVSQWEDDIESIVNYNSLRLGAARIHVNDEFELDGQVDVTLNVEPAGAGRIHISTISPSAYPWQGVYYNGCPVQITAIPNPGYEFDHWNSNDVIEGLEDDQQYTVNIFQDDLFTAVFQSVGGALDVELSEINYHPHPLLDGGEWFELHNNSSSAIDVSLWEVSDGTSQFPYEIPVGTVIAPGDYLVVCGDASLFAAQYPEVDDYVGDFDFVLGNSAGNLVIKDSWGSLVIEASYGDSSPWPPGADGMGRTLEHVDGENYTLPSSWFDGCMGGSPGEAWMPCDEPIVVSEINYNSLPAVNPGDWLELRNMTSETLDLEGWIVLDAANNSFAFGAISLDGDERVALVADPTAFDVVFTCHTLGQVVGPSTFGLGNGGDEIYVLDAAGSLIFSMKYDDGSGWPGEADGYGMTLELIDPTGDVNDPQNWQTVCPQGSPTQAADPTCLQNLSITVLETADVLEAQITGGTPNYEIEWFLNFVSVGMGVTLNNPEPGIYVVVVTDSQGCMSSSEVVYYNTVGISNAANGLLSLSPNPNNGLLTVELPVSNGMIRILDNLGREVYLQRVSDYKEWLDLSHLESGHYLLEWVYLNEKAITRFIIK
jgi:hypothetical protein